MAGFKLWSPTSSKSSQSAGPASPTTEKVEPQNQVKNEDKNKSPVVLGKDHASETDRTEQADQDGGDGTDDGSTMPSEFNHPVVTEDSHDHQGVRVEAPSLSFLNTSTPALTEETSSHGISSSNVSLPATPAVPSPEQPSSEGAPQAQTRSSMPVRRFSLRSLTIFNKPTDHKPALSAHDEHKKEERAAEAWHAKHAVKQSSSDKRAKESALIVRSLIVGPTSISPSSPKAKAVTKPQLSKVKSQLMQPKSANRVIAQLRELPLTDASVEEAAKPSKDSVNVASPKRTNAPIHAVCLQYTEPEAHERHFARLALPDAPSFDIPSVMTASLDTVTAFIVDLHVVDLLAVPDFGLGHGVGTKGEGILSGALPSPQTVITGITRITPELMNLGYATGKSILPDHSGIYPPKDRLSVLTYWWGLELLLPPPSLQYLGHAPSISHSVINFLTALAAVNNGVREIMPFVRYISQYIDFEWNYIKGQDRGKGVVCAATWIMPAAMVPRPWDFPDAPPKSEPSEGEPATEPAPVDSGSPGAPPIAVAADEPSTSPDPPALKVTPPTLTKNSNVSELLGSSPGLLAAA